MRNCKSLLFTSSLAERPMNTPRYSKWATSQLHSHCDVAMTPLNVIQQSGHRPGILLLLSILATAILTTFLHAYKRRDFSFALSATRPSIVNRSKLARSDSIATSITARRAIQQTSDDEAYPRPSSSKDTGSDTEMPCQYFYYLWPYWSLLAKRLS